MPLGHILNPQGEHLDVAFHPGAKHDALVILGHGLTGNKDRPLLIALAEGLSARGWPCLRVSYAGNGNSGGAFEDSTITKETGDLKAVLGTVPDFVRIAYVGHSMGGAVGVLTAAEDLRIRALVTLAGMARTREFVQREFGDLTPGRDFMWDEPGCPFGRAFVDDLSAIGDTFSAAARISQPWLLLHGEADDVIPIEDSISSHAAAVSAKKFVSLPGANHVFEGHYPAVLEETDSWLKQHLAS